MEKKTCTCCSVRHIYYVILPQARGIHIALITLCTQYWHIAYTCMYIMSQIRHQWLLAWLAYWLVWSILWSIIFWKLGHCPLKKSRWVLKKILCNQNLINGGFISAYAFAPRIMSRRIIFTPNKKTGKLIKVWAGDLVIHNLNPYSFDHDNCRF